MQLYLLENYFEMYPIHKDDSKLFVSKKRIMAITAYRNSNFQKGHGLSGQETAKEPENLDL